MTPVLIALFGIVATGGSAALGAKTALWWRDRQVRPELCSSTNAPHIWGPWESAELLQNGLLPVPGQQRACVNCGESETRRVLPR